MAISNKLTSGEHVVNPQEEKPILDVTVDEYRVIMGGKNSIRLGDTDTPYLRVLRYDREWRDVTGDNLIYSLAQEVQDLRDEAELTVKQMELVREDRLFQAAEESERLSLKKYLELYKKNFTTAVPILGALIDDILMYLETRGEVLNMSFSEVRDRLSNYEHCLRNIANGVPNTHVAEMLARTVLRDRRYLESVNKGRDIEEKC